MSISTDDRNDPGLGVRNPATGMDKSYLVLSEEERAKGFVRPVRRSYRHLTCGTVTTMAQALAETYARQPSFYGATFCAGCRTHRRFVFEDELEVEDRCPWCAGPQIPGAILGGHEDCFRRRLNQGAGDDR